MKRLSEYLDSVLDGERVVGRLERLAVERHVKDLKNPELEFRVEDAQRAISFIEILQHSTDNNAGKPFILENWEVFIVSQIFGFYWKGTNKLRFNSSYIQIARKNGKSSLTIAMALYHFISYSNKNAEVLLGAGTAKQAKDVLFKILKDFCNRLDPHGEFLKQYYNEVRFKNTGSYFKIMAGNVDNLAGYNTSFAIVDEYAFSKNHQIREMFRTSMVSRENPHLLTITTAGWDMTGPCYALRESCINLLEGIAKDESMFVMIFEMDEDDDWTNPDVWIKSNPNLGVTVSMDAIQDGVTKAMNTPSIEVDVKTLTLNKWVQSKETWIPDKYLGPCFEDLKINDFIGEECNIGVDLASVSDISSVVIMFVKDQDDGEHFYFFPLFYIPYSTLHDRADSIMYKTWKEQGLITVTDGNTTNYSLITNDLLDIDKDNYIRKISYDKWNSEVWAIDCQDKGLPMEQYSQAIGNFVIPVRQLEKLIIEKKAHFQNNEIMITHFRNVSLRYDSNANCKPDKGRDPLKKIDGCIAAIQALGGYLYDMPKGGSNIY